MKDLKLYEKIPKDDYPARIVMYDTHTPYDFPIHWHEHIEMHYIIEGDCVSKCENDTVTLEQGDVLIINSNELHQGVEGNCRYICLILSPSFMVKKNSIINRKVSDDQVKLLFDSIIEEYNKNDQNSMRAISGYACLLMSCLYRNCTYKEYNDSGYRDYSQKTIMMNKIIMHIHKNYTDDISLEKMANMFHISQYYFCHIFKQFTQKTLKEYVNTLRVEKALELLQTTEEPIGNIAFMCGFNDSNYFSRKFREITGRTPRSYRDLSIDRN